MRWIAPLFALLAACGAPPCASSLACGQGSVCGLDGRCGPLDPPAGARFARSRWIAASDWGTSSIERAPLTDALTVGAGAEALLAFGPLPERPRILRALLVLHPHGEADRVREETEIVVERVEPFSGGALRPRIRPGPRTFAAALTALPRGPLRPLRVDLTGAAIDAAGRGDRTLFLLVRSEGRATFRSPWALDEGVPRLELLVH